MPKAKKTKKKATPPFSTPRTSVYLCDEPRLSMVQEVFKSRGLPISLTAMVKIVIDEWLRAANGGS